MTLPNFIIIGAQKAGTTSVYEYLQQHPDVFMSAVKEPHFFSYVAVTAPTGGYRSRAYRPQPRITDPAAYAALFADAGTARAIGEASPSYLYSPDAAREIHARVPDARLIAILRNPIDRAFSNYNMNRRIGQEPLESFEAALAAEDERVAAGWGYAWHYARKGRYAEQLERYRALFPSERLLVTLHDDLVADPRAFMRRLYEFLEIEPTFEADLTVSSNVAGVPRSPALAAVLRPAMLLHRYWSPLVPARARQRLRGTLLERPVMRPETRALLRDAFAPDVEALARILGRDLSHWLAERNAPRGAAAPVAAGGR